jgi:hypothetical protein
MLLAQTPFDDTINYKTILELAIATIKQFQPRRLSDVSQSPTTNSSQVQYRKEFYRCLFHILDGHFFISPEVMTDTNGGSLDFTISQRKWGLHLLGDRNRLDRYMERNQFRKQYVDMMQSGALEQNIVLNFTTILPTRTYSDNTTILYPWC